MPAKRRMTFDAIPEVDSSSDLYNNAEKVLPITAPDGRGWTHQQSFLGNNSIVHIWKQGIPDFDDGYELYWTGCGDDVVNGVIGTGEDLIIEIADTDTEDQYVDIEFIADDTYLYGGQAMWTGSQLYDSISLVVVANATQLIEGGDLSLSIDNDNKVYFVGAGNGTHSFAAIPVLVENKQSTGYWIFNTESKSIDPSPTQTGGYDIYVEERTVARLLNKIPTSPNNDGYVEIQGNIAWKVFNGYKFRFIAHTNQTNPHAWTCSLFLHMFRKDTI